MTKCPHDFFVYHQGILHIVFDGNSYSLNAIKKAAYKFTDLYGVLIDYEPKENKISVSFKALNSKFSASELEALALKFCNEVLDQDLRESIGKETAGLKNLIIAQAFSKTSLINQEQESTDILNQGLVR